MGIAGDLREFAGIAANIVQTTARLAGTGPKRVVPARLAGDLCRRRWSELGAAGANPIRPPSMVVADRAVTTQSC